MIKPITQDQKEVILDCIREHCSLEVAAERADVTLKRLQWHLKNSKMLRKQFEEAKNQSKDYLADKYLHILCEIADGKEHASQSRVTSILAILNWAKAGFRGTTKITGDIKHTFPQIKTGVPRPQYKLKEIKVIGGEKCQKKK